MSQEEYVPGSPGDEAERSFQGIPVSAIAEEFGTPAYVYDSAVLREGYTQLRGLLPAAVDIFYSLKANPNVSICGVLNRLGAGAEISSLVELRTALRAGVLPRDIIFLGPGKTTAELEACLEAGIHAVVCESLEELRLLDRLAADRGLAGVGAMLRVNPEFHTKGSGLAMGGKPRQFGIDTALLRAAAPTLAGLRAVRVRGLHAYMGTRFLNHADVVHNTAEILRTSEELARELGITLDTLDFGGGLGIAYFDNEKDLDVEALAAGLREVVEPFAARFPDCRLIMELGRFLTAPAGTYVTRALYVKESMGEQFVVADGGTNHHMAAVGIGSFVKRNFPIASLTRYHAAATEEYTLAGPLCTPNDVIGKRVALPPVRAGDLIGVERSGAYGPSASPVNFLSHGHPAEVLVHEGRAQLIRRRATVDDLLEPQRLIDL
ncbi:diaminopimelate decarboxylase [Streptomyces albus]|uniref:Diaminopimelate decarboxylase n=1 Tax=Streptomyces albus (strain ATCC 21838 / DSM 41398 / FERM P-419 / JCM 4703 / NBRC 107858) TaxID=1081613 RepID=A0A0B5F303_STRA4|nr:diaminopimelate decarboxylase [Streptomyces albus]AOU80267.1 diaminopimelate decarboxylase [Streptomyces albus]AYN35982.1 diaminopimelate decarboxylase [Streptomyces albus]